MACRVAAGVPGQRTGGSTWLAKGPTQVRANGLCVVRVVDSPTFLRQVIGTDSNVDSDEIMFYVDGDYEARKGSGINKGSISIHPGGHTHGPQPGAIESSLGVQYFEELAVMVDTFKALELGEGALACEDPEYSWSWAKMDAARKEAGKATLTEAPMTTGTE